MPSEKQIFPYIDSEGRQVWGDPLAIDRELCLLLDGTPGKVIDDFNSPIAEIARPAAKKLISAVCAAFSLGEPFDRVTGKGATLETILAALEAFTAFMELKKKKVEPSPMCSPATEPPAAIMPSSLAFTLTAPAYDSSGQLLQPLASSPQ